MAWISFGALPCRGKKNLMTARVSKLLKSRASLGMLPFSLCNKKRLAIWHVNRPPLSNDTIDSVLWHREVGRAKDLSARPRIQQLVCVMRVCWLVASRIGVCSYCANMIYDMIWYDIFVNCNWVVTRWQKYSTRLHTNNTQNDTKQTIHSAIQLEECGPCPVLASYTLTFALQPRKKHG